MKNRNLKALSLMLLAVFLIAVPVTVEAAYMVEDRDNPNDILDIDAYFSNDINSFAELDESGTLAYWSASVYGFTGDSQYDYYSFSVGTGKSPLQLNTPVVFDIDFAAVNTLDTKIVLYDIDGISVLDSNDDSDFRGPGDIGRTESVINSFLSYTFTNAGTYYISVEDIDYDAEAPFYANYQLHVSSVPIPGSMILLISGLLGVISIRWKSGKRLI